MREKFIVRSVQANNGIRRIHLTHDVYRDELSQPMDRQNQQKSKVQR
jgi:hypothetical protein